MFDVARARATKPPPLTGALAWLLALLAVVGAAGAQQAFAASLRTLDAALNVDSHAMPHGARPLPVFEAEPVSAEDRDDSPSGIGILAHPQLASLSGATDAARAALERAPHARIERDLLWRHQALGSRGPPPRLR